MFQLRPTVPEDEPLLLEIYASTRRSEMAGWGWPPAQQEAFLRMQYGAQRFSYQTQHPEAEQWIVMVEGQPAGRIITAHSFDGLVLVDISLLPQFRGARIGTALIRCVQAQAAAEGLSVHLHVRKSNPAQHLYRRLGFTDSGEDTLYFAMQWRPAPPAPEH